MCEKIYSIEEIKSMLYEILKKADVRKAILFGSYARNTSTSTSDIDIVMPYIIKSYEISKYNPVDLKNNFIELYYNK